MVYEDKTRGTGVDEAAFEVAPAKARNKSRGNERHGQEHLDVPAMLELDDRIAREVTDVGNTRFPARLENHPADMRP